MEEREDLTHVMARIRVAMNEMLFQIQRRTKILRVRLLTQKQRTPLSTSRNDMVRCGTSSIAGRPKIRVSLSVVKLIIPGSEQGMLFLLQRKRTAFMTKIQSFLKKHQSLLSVIPSGFKLTIKLEGGLVEVKSRTYTLAHQLHQ